MCYQAGWPKGCHPSERPLRRFTCPHCSKTTVLDANLLGYGKYDREDVCFDGCGKKYTITWDKTVHIKNTEPKRNTRLKKVNAWEYSINQNLIFQA